MAEGEAGRELLRAWEVPERHWCAFPCGGALVVVTLAGRRKSNNEPSYRKQWVPDQPRRMTDEQWDTYYAGLRGARAAIMQRLIELGESP
jgi:hypothetical protein